MREKFDDMAIKLYGGGRNQVDQQFSDELTDLLTKLKKGHRVDMGKVIHGLSDVEREIFMKAMDQKNKKQRDEFEEMIKDKDQMIKTLKDIYGKPMSEWTW